MSEIYQPQPGEFYVYVYSNPLKPGCPPFYVGKGQDNRVFDHLEPNLRERNNHKARTIRKIIYAGLEPKINCAYHGDDEQYAFKVERLLIAMLGRRCDSGILTNLRTGGEGGTLSKETKLKMSNAKKGRRMSEETRRKLSEAKTGTHHSEDTLRKMKGRTPWNKGKSGVQTCWIKGKLHSSVSRRKMSEAHKGKRHSEETRRKMSEAQKRRFA